nr:MAG TPA: hypothetical protein [Caudoviricetes sp.]
MDILNCAKSKFITNKCNNNQDVNLTLHLGFFVWRNR